ncbi:hypothetical protein [Dactylosporangium sp. NPDC051484]|uniref:hypothetical protein n=1 Tax=Dactylosporangium sp. NPDC051484 TaxID=3154942 RepID=UPI00344C7DF6
MQGHPGTPLPFDLLTRRLWVVDVIYRPFETALLGRLERWAAERRMAAACSFTRPLPGSAC